MTGFITTFLADLDALVHKAEGWIKTEAVVFEGFLKPFLQEIAQALLHIGEADLLSLGQIALAGLKSGQGEAEIISGLKTGAKALLPLNVNAGETALFGVASAILSNAKVTLAADPTQHTNS